MKKNLLKVLAAFSAVFLLTGCGDADKALHEMRVEKYVTLGDYSNLTLEVDSSYLPIVEDEEIYEVMNSLYVSYVTEEDGITNRAVQNGDTVIIDYVGKKDGVAFQGGTASGASLEIGSGQFIAGFEDGLIGVMPGDTVDLDLTFPENYGNAELAGQPVVFTVTVHYILPTEVPENKMKDSVVAAIGLPEVETVEQYRAYVRDYLESSKQQNYDYFVQNGIIEQVLGQSRFEELPEELLQRYRDKVRTNLTKAAAQYNVSLDTYCNYYFQQDSESYIREYGERYLKQDLAFQAIANVEGLAVDDAELDSKLAEMAQEAGAASVEELIGDTAKDDFRNYFMNKKIMEYLQSKTTVAEKAAE
ncbi:MAG: trigger factor [Acetatifactor sp.]